MKLPTLFIGKKGVTLSDIIIGVILFSLIMVLMGLIVQDSVDNYDIGANPVSEEYNKLESINDLSTEVFSSFESINQSSTLSGIDAMITGSYNSLRISFSSFQYVNTLMERVVMDLGIPPIVFTALISIVLITITFAVLAGLFKFRF